MALIDCQPIIVLPAYFSLLPQILTFSSVGINKENEEQENQKEQGLHSAEIRVELDQVYWQGCLYILVMLSKTEDSTLNQTGQDCRL